jgi:phospholipid-translocating ATPase
LGTQQYTRKTIIQFSNFPVFAIIFDEDVEKSIALKYPPLYRSLQKGRDLNSKTFLIWVWKSIYQGVIIIVMSIFLFKNIFIQLETVAFTALIFTEYAMTLSEVERIIFIIVKLHPHSNDHR